MSEDREKEGLKHLGNNTKYSMDYAPEVLETFVNKHPQNDYWVQFNCPEFTSLCPITGQPDFAEIRIAYIPNEKMVESKSLKLYLFSFRNHGDFHEDCINIIMKDLISLMNPKYIEVIGYFTPRGGISIYPFANYGMPNTKYEKMAKQRFVQHSIAK
ncbi:preQ(1) synthase [Hoylesella nanceiensis]|uniref:preQ(1) synthase n=1 Tax=Hoylesella nanceiensis TaxID=425941 RepID=UPI001CB5EBBE|nr:preQ(1) synthase [Hoylesella nanceiensis]MBF1420275.1 NADPH-dependent 7-cyano-7-deazaguanine reductase QueF [Hoylesella nanceiensis]